MSKPSSRMPFVSRRKPLAACIAALFALSAPAAMAATTWTVNSCSEANSGSGTTGTLRYAAANAADNDTIDMTGLSCSTISLQTGAITFAQNNITLNGPGMANLAVTGKYNVTTEHDRIFTHTGTGTFAVKDLSVTRGYLTAASGTVAGGCIYSAGAASLSHVSVYSCSAYTKASGRAKGGGVFGKTGVTLKYSVLSGNKASGGSTVGAYGGGVYANGALFAKYSTISGNTAEPHGFGGGVLAYVNATIRGSTISGNTAGDNGGGVYTHNFFSSGSVTTKIENSTISGNSAHYYTGGVAVNSGTLHVYNSSIVFNTANRGRFGNYPFTYRAPGLATDDTYGAMAVTLQSSLIANNTYGSTEYDLSVPKRASTTVTFSGNNNLVRATFANVPSDTIKISCPRLGPLRNNGGPTQTHALLSHSPGIDQGNNTVATNEDQRGQFLDAMPYPYPRVSGSQADIGAYEVQQGDIIFNNGFEGCPLLF